MNVSLFFSRQFAVFVAGGVICALADIGLMQLLLNADLHYTAAASAGFAVGLAINYAFHSRITFNAAASTANFARYMCLVGVNYLLTLACVALAQLALDNPLAGKLLSLPLVAANGYLVSKYWIFK
ncbi:MAG: GtrA family protein [Telluria sp.]